MDLSIQKILPSLAVTGVGKNEDRNSRTVVGKMKKLWALLLVFGMASMANAMMLQISVNGELNPADSEIFLTAGDTAVLDIWSPDGYSGYGDDVYFFLIVETTYGYISGGVVTPNAPCDTDIPDVWIPGPPFPPGYNGILGGILCEAGTPADPGVYIDEIFFRCESAGDATIQLWTTVDGVTMTLQDTVIIHQIVTIYVATDGNDTTGDGSQENPFATIQKAIDTATYGCTVIVRSGTYTGPGNKDIDFLGKAITVRSENGPENCIIDCNGSEAEPYRGFYFHNSETHSSVLTGLTITNGWGADGKGGGIYCTQNSCPLISKCRITGNFAYSGGGICCDEGSSPRIRNCNIDNNCGCGGGMHCEDSSPEITNCVISNNVVPILGNLGTPGGGIATYRSSPTIDNCIISDNTSTSSGGGVFCYKGNPIINKCTISCNSADGSGGAVLCYANCSVTVSNCILWDNTAGHGPQISLVEAELLGGCPTFTISYSDVQGGQGQIDDGPCWRNVHWGPGNIDGDPLFADTANGDYHLKSQAGRWDPNSQTWVHDDVTSPCIDAGNPGCPLDDEPNDANNIRINMGGYGGTAQASKSPANWALLADLTNDHIVDFNDLEVFVQYWLDNGQCIPSNLNRSQYVDFADFAIFSCHWMKDNNP
jgi:hypothetical protein